MSKVRDVLESDPRWQAFGGLADVLRAAIAEDEAAVTLIPANVRAHVESLRTRGLGPAERAELLAWFDAYFPKPAEPAVRTQEEIDAAALEELAAGRPIPPSQLALIAGRLRQQGYAPSKGKK